MQPRLPSKRNTTSSEPLAQQQPELLATAHKYLATAHQVVPITATPPVPRVPVKTADVWSSRLANLHGIDVDELAGCNRAAPARRPDLNRVGSRFQAAECGAGLPFDGRAIEI